MCVLIHEFLLSGHVHTHTLTPTPTHMRTGALIAYDDEEAGFYFLNVSSHSQRQFLSCGQAR